MLTRVDSSLDCAVVLFQNVIQVRHWSMPAIPLKGPFGFESHDRGRVRAVTVVLMTRGVGWFALPSALARNRLAAAASCLAERRKSRVAPEESTAR